VQVQQLGLGWGGPGRGAGGTVQSSSRAAMRRRCQEEVIGRPLQVQELHQHKLLHSSCRDAEGALVLLTGSRRTCGALCPSPVLASIQYPWQLCCDVL
jgi:hypothetical protein